MTQGIRSESHSVVLSFAGGMARNRQVAALNATVEALTWDIPIKELTMTVVQEANATAAAAIFASIGACFDAQNDLVASLWLTAGDMKAYDSQMFNIAAGMPRTFYFEGEGITRVDIKRLTGAENLAVYVEAA